MRLQMLRKTLGVLAAAVLVAGCGPKSEKSAASGSAGDFPVGLVFDVGGRGDKSFNDAAYRGLERAQQELGITFQTLESGEGADREAQMRQLAASGSQLVFG